MSDQWDQVAAAMRAAVADAVAAVGTQTPPPTQPPTQPPPPVAAVGVDLARWKLTLPVVVDGKVQEIRPPALGIYSDKYFWRDPANGSLRFRVWHGGGTTSGSSNPRSELRERVGDDPEGYWNAGTWRHSMEWTGQVNRLTKVKPHVVIGQVHDDKDDVVVWRVEADKLWLTKGDDPHGYLVDGAFQLGKPYTCRYEITDGAYRFQYNGQWLAYTLKSTAKSYFKVGNYLQSNPKTAPGESTDEYAEVIVTGVKVEHQVIELLGQVDPATWATVVAGLGSAAGVLGGKWFGHRSAVRSIEAGATARVAGGYGDLLTDLQEQLERSSVDRSALHDDIALLRVRLREVESTARVAATKFEQLLEHVRVLRTILHEHKIEHPEGPDFLADGGAT